MPDILQLSKFEEHIYNTHLKISRQHKNLPFKYRKDFGNVSDKTKAALKKISLFLQKFEHIKLEDFILAPYKIYKDEDFFDITYYTTLKATKAYSLYQNSLLYEDPDSLQQINNIVESLKYLQSFCQNKHITLDQYLTYQEDKLPCFLVHLKEHKVNLYTLLGLKNFIKEFSKIDAELTKFILGEETYNRVQTNKNKLLSSKKAFSLITQGLLKINENLKK
jgi:hypothetical protein